MKVLWCWRCTADMPMLDEEEFSSISRLYSGCIRATKKLREATCASLENANLDERFKPVRLHYEGLTGMKDCHHNAIMHHRLAIYGPPCRNCGRPLRTPRAKLCGSCMIPVIQTNHDQIEDPS